MRTSRSSSAWLALWSRPSTLLRSNMNLYFLTTRVRKQELLVQSLVDRLCDRLQACKDTGGPINLPHAFTCLTTDDVSNYTMSAGFH
ncbi:hypothetical protein BJX76DRAFT_335615 [Aspergillus varians]